ncbi:MAG: TRAP transporter small permease subunit [SAR324 cluster bacterium]|nr:TRAP transporter small permease subunit [SAR324 cluster bacterium]
MNAIVKIVEMFNEGIGKLMGWVMVSLVLLVTADVIARKFFNFGMVIVQETEWWLFSIIFLSCAGYTFLYDEHVRVDIVYSKLTQKGKDIVDLICAFVFLFPMCALLVVTSLWFIEDSWNARGGLGEISADPGGWCCYYVLKSFIPFGFFLLALQGAVNVYKIILALMGNDIRTVKEDSLSVRAARMVEQNQ